MEYTSKYPELGFYVNGEVRYFRAGRYVTDEPEAIAVLDTISDTVRVESEVTKVTTEAKAPRKANAIPSVK